MRLLFLFVLFLPTCLLAQQKNTYLSMEVGDDDLYNVFTSDFLNIGVAIGTVLPDKNV